MTPVEKLLPKLNGVKKTTNGWSACCPAHDDRRPSLSIAEGDDGTALVRCHAGCAMSSIASALRLEQSEFFPAGSGSTPIRNGHAKATGATFPTAEAAVTELERHHGKRAETWTYRDADGTPVGVVTRWDTQDGKVIRPVARHADGWRIGAMPEPRPVYRLPELAKARLVVVTEGEKAADAARSLGFTATTSAGGSQAAHMTDWRPLAGKEVWVLPDNDMPGRKYAETIADILSTLPPAPVVRVVELPGLPDGGDIVDWMEAHGDAAEPEATRAEVEALAHAAEPWRPLEGDDLGFRPFPTAALPEPIRGYVVAGARAIGCEPSYLALPLLTAIAAAIGNTRRLELKRGWSVPPILWGAIVGESGTAKTPAFRLVMRPIRERQGKALKRHAEAIKRHEADLARWEKDMAEWKKDKAAAGDPPPKPDPPQAERLIVADTTVEALAPILQANPRGVLLGRDELAGWIGSFDRYAGKGKAGADSANWLSMFNAESIIVDRKTGVPRTIHVPHAAVCVAGGIQPAILQRVLGTEHRESGLAARLLLTWPPRQAKRWTDADIDPSAETDLAQLLDRLYELRPAVGDDGESRPVLVRLSTDAKSAWKEYYNSHAIEQADLTGDMAAAWSKLEEYAARLALVVHFARWAANDPSLKNPDNLDAASMRAGITLANWFKHDARRVYAMLDETDTQRDERRLVDWIDRKGGTVTAREVQQGCRWLRGPGAAEAALGQLVKDRRGIWEPSPPGQRGQPTRRFRLATLSTVYGNASIPEENNNTVDVDGVDTATAAPKSEGSAILFGASSSAGPYGERL
jgi:hypothetical protein